MSRIPNDELHTEKIVYETYFGEMEISDEEKKERLELAKELEPIFISFFYAFLESGEGEEDFIQSLSAEYEKSALKFLKVREPPAYIKEYSEKITEDIIRTTIENKDTPYFTSVERAMNIAANEANTIGNYREYTRMVKQGYKYKTWITMNDDKVRHTHAESNGYKIGIFDSFQIGASEMSFPRDYSLGASAEEIVNCRCSLKYTKT